MRPMTISACCLGILLAALPALAPAQATADPTADPTAIAAATTPAETATRVRLHWAKAKQDYLAAVQPYAAQPANAALLKQYTAALDKTGLTLEKYLALKLATPATPPAKLTPVVDQLIKDLTALRTLRAKAKGPLANALGAALTQHNQVAQAALKNMR